MADYVEDVGVSVSGHDGSLTLGQATVVDPEQVLDALASTREGLTAPEAASRLSRVGANVLPIPRGPSLARELVGQLVHFFALMLWVAAAARARRRDAGARSAIVVVIVVNGVFSFAQEYRAERSIRALSRPPARDGGGAARRAEDGGSPPASSSPVTSSCSRRAIRSRPTRG